ncbi:MAG: serine hydrolase domain-containing protein [Saprospiraceae bacterium]|nr:serine hydrolase domain-containing protein [Saprospiraceae bacterium]
MILRLRPIAVVVVSLLAASAWSQYDDFAREMDALTGEWWSDDAPGGVILVMKGEETVYQRVGGLADLGTGTPIDVQTIFNTGSISKTFVANAILILHEEGKLSIDDPLSRYFDDFADPKIAEAVTIRHLLSHTSGLPDSRNVRADPAFYMTARDTANFAPLKQTRDFKFEPGSRFEYSNPAYNGLALIVERVSGRKWQDFIRDRIFRPAGMQRSTITDGPHPATGVAHAYEPDGEGGYAEYDYGEFPTFAASGNGGVWCSIGDLVKYERALQAGKIISPELLQESRTPWHPDNWSASNDPQIGYSWFIDLQNAHTGGKIVYHTGSQGGFRAFHIWIPDRDVIFCALFNQPFDSRRLFAEGLALIAKHGI